MLVGIMEFISDSQVSVVEDFIWGLPEGFSEYDFKFLVVDGGGWWWLLVLVVVMVISGDRW